MTRLQGFVAVFVTAVAVTIACSDSVMGPDQSTVTDPVSVPSEQRGHVRLVPFVAPEQWTRALPRDTTIPSDEPNAGSWRTR